MGTSRLHILTPASAEQSDSREWIYLGKDADRRLRLERARGRPAAALGNRMHGEADRLRKPFLDLVAALGRDQRDLESWWAGGLAWKAWTASDLFLLSCYQAVCLRLAAESEPMGASELLIVIEDPWLFAQLESCFEGKSEVSFGPAPSLAWERVRDGFSGAARRLRWSLRMLWSRLRQEWHCSGTRPRVPETGGVLLYSYLVPGTFEGERGWKERYLPGLTEDLARDKATVVRCTYPDSTGWEKELGARASGVAPLILYASLGGLWRALRASPPPPPRQADLAGMPVGTLLEGQWSREDSSASRAAYLFHLDAVRRLMKAMTFKSVVMPWEGQPQERMLVLAAREAGVRSIGCQHSTVSRFQLPMFLGEGEADFAPIPDVILLTSRHTLELFKDGGNPEQRLRVGGSRRFSGLRPPEDDGKAPRGGGDVLVVLPVGASHARNLLVALARAFPKGGDGFTFVIKPHPGQPLETSDLPLKAQVETGTFPEALERCGVVVFCATAAALEAWSLGHPVLRYRADALLDIDPQDVLEDSVLPTAGDSNIAEKLRALRRSPGPIPVRRLASALEELFAPVDRKVWTEEILEKAFSRG